MHATEYLMSSFGPKIKCLLHSEIAMQPTTQHHYLGGCHHNIYFSANQMSAVTKGCHNDLQVGYDQHSFGYRDLEGTKVNNMHFRRHA